MCFFLLLLLLLLNINNDEVNVPMNRMIREEMKRQQEARDKEAAVFQTL
jgi:hypothetical protein